MIQQVQMRLALVIMGMVSPNMVLGTAPKNCSYASGNCGFNVPVVNGKLGECDLSEGTCKSSSCSGNGFYTAGGSSRDCKYNCPWQNSNYVVNCIPYKPECTSSTSNTNKCFGFTKCTAGDCPRQFIGLFCLYRGHSSHYRLCDCGYSRPGFISQCPTSTCGYSYNSPVGGPTTCSASSYCPRSKQCADGNCALPGPDADCACASASSCIGKCCPSTGKCRAASCDGNRINTPSGHERECVVNKDKTNSGGQCPWGGYSYGVKCNYLAGCSTGPGLKNNCWGYTACALGTCPASAVGVMCIESGNSDNFKVCGCADPNTNGVASNCTAVTPPQNPPAVSRCANGNCAPAAADPTCTATCAGGACVGRCCAATGACAAASCDGNRLNDPSGHERECVVKKDATNAGGQCPWSGQAYGVKCTYLAGCATGQGRNCWGYTACALGTCPASAVGVMCIESGSSDNFKVCGCAGEGSVLPAGAAVAYANCTVNATVIADTAFPCPTGYYCRTPCSAVICPCGSYCPAGATAAIPCPRGSYCPERSVAPIPGTYLCPAGFYCPPPTVFKYYCSATLCPCGSRCPAGTTAPQKCAAPFYCPNVGMSVQAICPMGFACPDKGMCNATACPLGSFVTCAGKATCDPCPIGRYCPNVTSTLLCPMGFYCPIRTFQPIPCPAGTLCYVGSKIAAPCPAGFYCPPGATAQIQCSPGSYCPGGGSAGIPCPAGTTAPDFRSSACSPAGLRREGRSAEEPRKATVLGWGMGLW